MLRHLAVLACVAVSAPALWAGCGGSATNFTGAAKVPGGPGGCFDRCAADGMQMSSFVYAGAYSTACVCTLKRKPGTPGAPEAEHESAATTAAVVAVLEQMRAAAQSSQQAAMAAAAAAH